MARVSLPHPYAENDRMELQNMMTKSLDGESELAVRKRIERIALSSDSTEEKIAALMLIRDTIVPSEFAARRDRTSVSQQLRDAIERLVASRYMLR